MRRDDAARRQECAEADRAAPVGAGIGGELRLNCGPHLIVDQRLMLAGVELVFMRYLTEVHLVREQPVDVSA